MIKTSQRLTSYPWIPGAIQILCGHYQNALFRLACVNSHLHNGNQSTETSLGIAISSAAAERLPDQSQASVCNMSLLNQPIIPFLNSS